MSNLTLFISVILTFALPKPVQQGADKVHKATREGLSLPGKAGTLVATIEKFSGKDHDSTIFYANQLRQVAGELKNDSLAGFATMELAWAYRDKGDLDQSIKYYFGSAAHSEKLKDKAGLGRAYLSIGQLFARANEYGQALKYYRLSESNYRAAGLDYKLTGTLYAMSKCYIETGAPATAYRLLASALEICPKDRMARRSIIHNRLGWAAKDKGDYATARGHYRKSLSGLDDSPKWATKRAIADNNIGESFLLEGKYDSARLYLKKALVKKEKLDAPDFTLSTYVLLAELAHELGNSKGALQLLDRGIAEVMATDKLSKNMREALALATSIINSPNNNVPLSATVLSGYLHLQQQQLVALQELKDKLDRSALKYNLQMGEQQYAHEVQARTLRATLASKEGTLTTQQRTVTGVLAFLVVVLGIAAVFGRKLIKGDRERVQGKNDFVKGLMKEHDYQLLQLAIVKAEYEEIIERLKKGPGLEGDFSA